MANFYKNTLCKNSSRLLVLLVQGFFAEEIKAALMSVSHINTSCSQGFYFSIAMKLIHIRELLLCCYIMASRPRIIEDRSAFLYRVKAKLSKAALKFNTCYILKCLLCILLLFTVR